MLGTCGSELTYWSFVSVLLDGLLQSKDVQFGFDDLFLHLD